MTWCGLDHWDDCGQSDHADTESDDQMPTPEWAPREERGEDTHLNLES